MAEVFKADIADIGPIAENMRDADKLEIWLSSHLKPYEALRRSLEVSDKTFTIVHDQAPIAMFGVRCQSLLGRTGVPWLLGTDRITEVRQQFIKEGSRWIEILQDGYTVLTNYVHEDNRVSIKWLKRLGFTIMPAVQAGPEMAWFHKFERISYVRTDNTDDDRNRLNGGQPNRTGSQRSTLW